MCKEFGTVTRWKLLAKQKPKFLDHFKPRGESAGSTDQVEALPQITASESQPEGSVFAAPAVPLQGTLKPRKRKPVKWQPQSANFTPGPNWDEFLARNHNHSSDVRAYVTLEQMDEIKAMKDDCWSLGLDLGQQGLPGFKSFSSNGLDRSSADGALVWTLRGTTD
jgi:hypothetical protein